MTVHIVQREVDGAAQQQLAGLPPLLARIYAARQVQDLGQLEYGLNRLQSPGSLKGIEQAVELLMTALQQQQRILVLADFDADGATSCALALRALAMMGAQQLDYIVPNRFEYGYGLSPEIVAVAARRQPDLIITVDNGISSLEGVAAAKQLGIQVLVTDHHLPGAKLPDADAMVNPNQPGDGFASKNLAGVGVIFYVMLALRAQLREQGWFARQQIPDANLAELLDLVALGTVADVVPLDHNNRVLVAQGLARIRRGKCCPGIQALLQVAGRNPATINSTDLGFVLGPRLNAAGRLDDMAFGIECLLCNDPNLGREMAAELDSLNRERRTIEQGMQQQALVALQTMQFSEEERLPVGLCLFDEGWHQGVIGILASRIKDRLHRPVIAFAPADDGSDNLKGSARSVSGVHIRDVLDAIAASHPQLLDKFGGHAMAAGLTLARQNLEIFQQAFDEEVQRHISRDALRGIIHSDGPLQVDEFTLEQAQLLRHASPWGQAFPEPVFDGEFEVLQRRIVGEKHLKLTLCLPGGDQPLEAIAFNQTDSDWPPQTSRVIAAYQLDINEFRGERRLQLLIRHVEPLNGRL